MASTDKLLQFILSADGRQAVSEFGRVRQAAERDLKTIERTGKNIQLAPPHPSAALGSTWREAQGQLERTQQGTSRLTQVTTGASGAVKDLGKAYQTVLGAAVAQQGVKWAKGWIDEASRLEQAIGATETVFGGAGAAVEEFAATSADSYGLSSASARELTGTMGALLQNLGLTADEAANTSVDLAKIGADLSAAFGGAPTEAVQALTSALRGERDPIERYGISITEAAVSTRALELGLAKTKGEISASAKAQATLSLITEQSAKVSGQFNRERETTAGQEARLQATLEETAAVVGKQLTPAYKEMMTTLHGVAGSLQDIIALADRAAGPIGGLGSAISGWVKYISPVGTQLSRLDSIGDVFEGGASMVDRFGSAVGAVNPALGGLVQRIDGVKDAVGDADGELFGVELSADGVRDALGGAWSRAADGVGALRDLGAEALGLAEVLRQGVTGGVRQATEALQGFVSGIPTGLERAADAAREFGEAIQPEAMDRVGIAAGRALLTLEQAQVSLAAAQERVANGGVSAAEVAAAAERAATDRAAAESDVAAALRELEEATSDVTAATDEATTAQRAYDQILRGSGANSAEAATAMRVLADAQRDATRAQFALGDAQDRLVEAQQAYNEVVADGGTAYQAALRASRDLRSAQLDEGDAVERVADLRAELAAAMAGGSGKPVDEARSSQQRAASLLAQAEANLSASYAAGALPVELGFQSQALTAARENLADATRDLESAEQEAAKARSSADIQRDLERAELGLADAKDATAAATKDADRANRDSLPGGRTAQQSARDLAEAQLDLEDAQQRVADAGNTATEAQQAYNEVVGGAPATSERARVAADDLRGAQERLRGAQDTAEQSSRELQAAQATLGAVMASAVRPTGDMAAAQRDLRSAELDVRGAALGAAAATAELQRVQALYAISTRQAGGAVGATYEMRQGLLLLAQAARDADTEVWYYREGLGQIASRITTELVLDGWVTEGARAAIEAALTFGQGASAAASVANAIFQARANGGPVDAMTPYIVGERGPELFVPDGAGSIVPHGRFQPAGGDGAGVAVNVTVEAGAVFDERAARRMFGELERRISRQITSGRR